MHLGTRDSHKGHLRWNLSAYRCFLNGTGRKTSGKEENENHSLHLPFLFKWPCYDMYAKLNIYMDIVNNFHQALLKDPRR